MQDKVNNTLSLEERFIFIERYRFAALYFAIPLVLSFSVVDYFYKTEVWFELFKIRLSIIPVALGTYYLYNSKIISERFHTIPALMGIFYFGLYHVILIYIIGSNDIRYYMGINIATVAFFTFLPWPPRIIPIAHVLNLAPFFVYVLLLSDKSFDQYVAESSFIFSFVFICTVAFYATRSLRRKEVSLRLELDEKNRTQQKVIEEKTQEGVYLEKLASQFSPQLIQAIKTGKLDIGRRLRKEITCIFVDVEKSTNKSSTLDYGDFVKLLSEFFTLASKIFLKNNITIGTYLGDGLLAFANAPDDNKKHRDMVLKAALELLSEQKKRSKYYESIWRSNFNIRIGINTGFAHLGFFPNDINGTYTALGETINLASRLCSISRPNEICVNKKFITDLSDKIESLSIERLGVKNDIKGFEGESYELFSIKNLIQSEIQLEGCPLCNGPLSEANEVGSLIVLKCTTCSYTDIKELDDSSGVKKESA